MPRDDNECPFIVAIFYFIIVIIIAVSLSAMFIISQKYVSY
jgi:hypothetical protein